MRLLKLIALSLLCLLLLVFKIIPHLSKSPEDFHKTEETFESSKIIKWKRLRRGSKSYLLIKTREGNEWQVGKTHSKQFATLNSKLNSGKKITFYTRNKANRYPSRVDLENEMIYDTRNDKFWYYFILIGTPILIFMTIVEYRTSKKKDRTKIKN
ncbi:hypothetical protein ACFSX9_11790 [Flavobacterium ardleyense]|uniref:DUF3592 domain-containing protein n=1 Tax=Flavobacterium ardleyense TaxID=2038737 RepID=A0ABW5ZAU8_9FLAO